MNCSNVEVGDKIIVYNNIYTVSREYENYFIADRKNCSSLEISKKRGKVKEDTIYVKIATEKEISDFTEKKQILSKIENLFDSRDINNAELPILREVYNLLFKDKVLVE